MPKNESWRRVSRVNLCPICGRADWCCVSTDESAALCQRVSEGAIKQVGEAGWLHRLRHSLNYYRRPRVRSVHIASPKSNAPDFGAWTAEFQAALAANDLRSIAARLGLSVESLTQLGIGWVTAAQLRQRDTTCRGSGCWTFPMVDAARRVLGIRLRTPDGYKYAVHGGHQGLFIPRDLTLLDRDRTLLIAEGPTDCAALLDLGFAAVGRPDCTGGTRLLVDLVRKLRAGSVVIVADADEPGLRGAEALASVLIVYVPQLRIITPPSGIKDVRAWKHAGATAADLTASIKAAPVRTLNFVGKRHAPGVDHE